MSYEVGYKKVSTKHIPHIKQPGLKVYDVL